jgi:Protein of unknown function (DUF3224)
MTSHATGKFDIKAWDESTYDDVGGGRKLTQAHVTQEFSGDIEGEGRVEFLMCYREDGTADFVGLHRIVGAIGGRSGSFVVQGDGTFDGSVAAGPWSVVPGSGTEELRGLRGEGGFRAKGHETSFTLDYEFE